MELITIKKENEKEVVSARELHKFLESKTQFKDWVKRRIEKYNFIENIDFILVAQKRATNNPRNSFTEEKDYLLTLDTAKEICMIENNSKGREARLYFIECEKKYLSTLESKNILANDTAVKIIHREFEEINKKEKLIEKLTEELKQHYKEIEVQASIKKENYETFFGYFKRNITKAVIEDGKFYVEGDL